MLFMPTYSLVQELLAAKRNLELPRALRKLDHFAVLILDDVGYVQQSPEEAESLFTLLAESYERRSVSITSNLIFRSGIGSFAIRWRRRRRLFGASIIPSWWSLMSPASAPSMRGAAARRPVSPPCPHHDTERLRDCGCRAAVSRLLCWRLRACRRSDAAPLTATDRPTTTTEYCPAVGILLCSPFAGRNNCSHRQKSLTPRTPLSASIQVGRPKIPFGIARRSSVCS